MVLCVCMQVPFSYSISLVDQMVKNLPAMQEKQVWSLGWEDPLKKRVATLSSILAWKIPWTEEPGRLQSMESQKVGHNWVTDFHLSALVMLLFTMAKINAHSATKRHYPIFLSLSQAGLLSYGMVFSLLASILEANASRRYRIQSASEWGYDWPIFTLIYGLCNLPWWLNAGDNERFPYILWRLNFQVVHKLTAPLSRLLSLACCQVEPEAGNTSDESVSKKKKSWLSFSGTWRMSASSFAHWGDSCGPTPGADMERAGGTVSLLPEQEISFWNLRTKGKLLMCGLLIC